MIFVGPHRVAREIALGADNFDANTAEKYGWINRAIPETELDDYVNGFAWHVLSFDGQALATAKQRLNQTFLPNPGQQTAGRRGRQPYPDRFRLPQVPSRSGASTSSTVTRWSDRPCS